MQVLSPVFKTKSAGQDQISIHLHACAEEFFPPLNQRVDINAYAKKLAEKAVTFEAWHDDMLIGLIAAYIDTNEKTTFITNVSVSLQFMGKGIAAELMQHCLAYVEELAIKEISLQVDKNNRRAIGFYKKYDFVIDKTESESHWMKRILKQ